MREAIKLGMAKPIGSITQLNTIRLGKRTDNNTPKIKDFRALKKIEDLGVWRLGSTSSENCYEAALHAGAARQASGRKPGARSALKRSSPCKPIFDSDYVRRRS